jgi:hypothetical protein
VERARRYGNPKEKLPPATARLVVAVPVSPGCRVAEKVPRIRLAVALVMVTVPTSRETNWPF